MLTFVFATVIAASIVASRPSAGAYCVRSSER
jgi:hypothetical protein